MGSPRVKSIITELKACPWDLRGKTKRTLIREHVAATEHQGTSGLYVFVFRNESTTQIMDRNATPKPVVPGRSWALKSGKYEPGSGSVEGRYLLNRLKNYEYHLHRAKKPAFASAVQHAWVLDLGKARCGNLWAARAFEPFWNGLIRDAFLPWTRHDRLNSRAEWIILSEEIDAERAASVERRLKLAARRVRQELQRYL